ncbi:MAG: hypothetical protein IPI11_02300 [Haliscomenobacter sp.]|nr:hypothetical protein [Haliscomenobacter sp.]
MSILDKTGLTYKQTDLLLSLSWIDDDDSLFIKHNDSSCDTAQKEIAGLGLISLDRIHRFLRWQKKSGWRFETLNEIIVQSRLGAGLLDDNCLIHAANLVQMAEAVGIPIDELIGFYGVMPMTEYTSSDKKPLYHRIFLNKAKNGFVDERLLPDNIDNVTLLSTLQTTLAVCLQTAEAELAQLLPLTVGGTLTAANLSFLFGATRLMRKLKLKAADFVTLRQLTGILFEQSPAATLAFIDAVKDAPELPLKLADVKFMLRHEAENLAEREIKEEKIISILSKLQGEIQRVFTATKSPFDSNRTAEEQSEILQAQLSKLETLSEGDVKELLGFVEKEYSSLAAARTFVQTRLNPYFHTLSVENALTALDAIPGGNDYSAESNALIESMLAGIAQFQFNQAKHILLKQALVSNFKADPETIKIVLKYARLKQAVGAPYIHVVLLSDTLIDTVNPSPVLPAITTTAFPNQVQALRLLHKMLPFIQSFKLDSTALAWHFQNNTNVALNWFLWDEIPCQGGQTPVNYDRFVAFAKMTTLSKNLTPVPNPADVENPVGFYTVLNSIIAGESQTAFPEKLALLLNVEKTSVEALDAHLFSPWNISGYANPSRWKKLETCLEYLRLLNSSVAEIALFVQAELTSVEAGKLRAALKSRYDEDTWLGVLKEIMDAIRSQKRDALVAYLLSKYPDFKNENDLYDYFLVDVEMEACMPSSRIVQAHGVVQLFTQRCLMGLEPDTIANVEDDPKWEQWKWMKNYRVWEANRKIFLYPENWLEPELRDDKSFLFTELENELQQNELTDFNAEQRR